MTAAWIEELTRPRFCEDESAANEQARWRRAAMRAFEESIPPLYRWSRLDSPLLARRVKLVIPSALPTAKSVVFMGPPAIGKTSLAVAMLRAMVERELATTTVSEDDAMRVGRRFRFVHAHRVGVARISGAEGLTQLAVAKHAHVLLLDDLDTDADVPSNSVKEVIQERHSETRTTWITTALDASGVAKRYGGGIARRVFEGATLFKLGAIKKTDQAS